MATPNTLRAMHGQHKDSMTKTNLFTANLDLLEETEGFNTREYDNDDVKAHIRRLADAYKAGDQLPPLTVKVRDGKILVRDGHCRRRAALLARSEGAEIDRLPVIEVRGDEVDESLVIVTSNEGLKLTAVERAKVYARLKGLNLTDSEIANKLHRTIGHVQQYLAINDLPLKLKEMIQQGVVSWSLALDTYNEKGTEAIDIIANQAGMGKDAEQASVSPSQAPGETAKKIPAKRVTRSSIDASNGYRSSITGKLAKRVAQGIDDIAKRIDSAAKTDECSDILIRISPEDAQAFKELAESIQPKKK